MKFEFVKKVDGEVNGYNGIKVKTGDRVEYEGHFAEKALKNPDYQEVKPGPKAGTTAKKAPAKKAENVDENGTD